MIIAFPVARGVNNSTGEIAPKEIRGRITGMFQVIVVIGVAFSYWINYGVTYVSYFSESQNAC